MRPKVQLSQSAHELASFAGAFPNEAHLTNAIAELLRKMGRESVQVTHGPQELGKDIVFYAPGGFSERRLYACVIKNVKITGNHASDDGVRVVLNQAQTAFSAPWMNEKGNAEYVEGLYVISPHDCSQGTKRVISADLGHRSGQVNFLCGSTLLDLFVEHWPDFVLFESGILTKYLSSLPKTIAIDSAVTALVRRHSLLADSTKPMSQVYVERDFQEVLLDFFIEMPQLPKSDLLYQKPIKQPELDSLEALLAPICDQLDEAPCEGSSRNVERVCLFRKLRAERVDEYQKLIKEIEAKRAKVIKDRELSNEKRRAQKKPPHPNLNEDDFISLGLAKPSLVDAALNAGDGAFDFDNFVEDLVEILKAIAFELKEARSLVRSAHVDNAMDVRGTREYLRARDYSRTIPDWVTAEPTDCRVPFGSDALNGGSAGILITGPAGFGKTSFCKWHALRDASDFLDGRNRILPIFVPLHQVQGEGADTFEDTLIFRDDLRDLLKSERQGDFQLRIYLDGLDEVPDAKLQETIVKLARLAVVKRPNTQVVITAREHVRMRGLSWLLRLRIADLSDNQTKELATKWLDADEKRVQELFAQLRSIPGLGQLMRVPLLGTLIIAVFRRTGVVPRDRIRLYELFVELHCGGWDLIKNVRRASQFGQHDKQLILSSFAAMLHYAGQRDGLLGQFKRCVRENLPGFTKSADILLSELLEDGLLTKVASNLIFSHLSFQEFLTAKRLSEPIGQKATSVLRRYYRGEDWWKEVMAFHVGMYSGPKEVLSWVEQTRNALVLKQTLSEIHQLDERHNYLIESIRSAYPGVRPL